MTRQQILLAMKNASTPLILAAEMSDEQLERYAEGPCRERLKESEAKRLRKYAEQNRAEFARYGTTPAKVVKAFEADKVTCFAEEYVGNKLDAGPSFSSTGDEKDAAHNKLTRKTSLDKGGRAGALTPDEKAAKMKESLKVRKWAESNARELEGRGSSAKKVIDAFMADDSLQTAEDFIAGNGHGEPVPTTLSSCSNTGGTP